MVYEVNLMVVFYVKNIIVYVIINIMLGYVYFDDIKFIGLGSVVSKEVESIGFLLVFVIININNIIRKVLKLLFGINIEWINNG